MLVIDVTMARHAIAPVAPHQMPKQLGQGKGVIWAVSLPNNRTVYMTGPWLENVVTVNASKLYYYWLKQTLDLWPTESIPCVPRNQMRFDYKYTSIDKIFQAGIENPVELPSFGCDERRGPEQPYIAITDGVTRLFWLISQGCRAFPVYSGTFRDAGYARKWLGV